LVITGTLTVMEWPPQSPDFNPIEQLWDHLDRQLRLKPATNVDKTFATLQDIWSEIAQDVLEVYVNSMSSRCLAVIAAKVGHTKY
jgi:hypothetical protein